MAHTGGDNDDAGQGGSDPGNDEAGQGDVGVGGDTGDGLGGNGGNNNTPSFVNPGNATFDLFNPVIQPNTQGILEIPAGILDPNFGLDEQQVTDNVQYNSINDFLDANFLNQGQIDTFNTQSFGNQGLYDTELSRLNSERDRRRVAGEELFSRYGQANEFNLEALPFHENLATTRSELETIGSALTSGGINDYLNIAGLESPGQFELGNLSLDQLAFSDPSFGDGTIDLSGFTGTPEVTQLTDIAPIQRLFDENQIGLDSLQAQYDTAFDSDNDFLRGIGADINQFNRDREGADIYGGGVLDNLNNSFNNLRYGYDLFDPLLDSTQEGLTGIQDRLGSIGDFLSDSQTSYDFEDDRLTSFLEDFDNTALGFGNTLDDLTIADLEGINSTDQSIADLLSDVLGFDSPIDFNNTGQIGLLNSLDDRADQLRDDRTEEERRIEFARTGFRDDISGITDEINLGDIYSGGAISNFGSDLDALEGNLSGFDSLLNPTFENVNSGIGDARGLIENLISERGVGIDEILQNILGAQTTGQETELYNEDVINRSISDLNSFGTQLGRFSGNVGAGLLDANIAGDDAIIGLENRLGELGDYRLGIEDQAQDLFGNINPNQLYRTDDVQGFRDQLAPINDEFLQYDAFAATNEIDDINELLDSADSRIASDAAATEARNAGEAANSATNLAGARLDKDYILGQISSGSLSDEEYLALLSKVRDQDPDFANTIERQYGSLFA